jgi:hypothetical protein
MPTSSTMPERSLAPVKCLKLRDVVLGRFLEVVAVILLASFSVARAATVTLAWNASRDSSVAGYKVYCSTVSGASGPFIDVGNLTTTSISNLNDSTTYYFSVTAYNNGGQESQCSNEIALTTPSRPPYNSYTLTADRGSGSGSYPAGTWVQVRADPPDRGEEFAYWDGDTSILQTPRTNSDNAAFIPLRDVTITAVYSASPTFAVIVTRGTGDGNYFAGDTVSIVADPAPTGQQFVGWTGNVTFANASSPTTTFSVASSAVTVAANYSTSSATTGTGLRAD